MRRANENTTNSVLVGAGIVVAIVVGVFLSYNANHGLPFVKTYPLTANVPDAAELVAGSEVRIGGFRVGQVKSIKAMPPRGKAPPYARLQLALDGTVKGIPDDTIVRVRPRSLLGAKYVELEPGSSSRLLPPDSTLPLTHSRPTPELDEAFNVFDPDTRRALQGTIREIGDATAGRGGDINRAVGATRRLLGPLQRVVEALDSPEADLPGLIDGAARFTSALAPVGGTIGQLADHGAATLAAIDRAGPALSATLDQLPGTEADTTSALVHSTPVLRDLADIAQRLGPGTRALPRAATRLDAALRAGTPVLRHAGDLTTPLDATLQVLDRISRDPAAAGTLRKLVTTIESLYPTLQYLAPAQIVCNNAGLWTRNVDSTASEGDQYGTWISLFPIFRNEQVVQSATPDSDLHFNYYPNENASECEAGNEPYAPGQVIGNPAGNQPTKVDQTAPPKGTLELARQAGLLDHIPGSRG